MKHPIAHFEIIGKDHDALVKFYSDIFEWKLERMPGGAPYSTTADWQPGDPGVGGGIGSSDEPDGRQVTFYIAVPDTDAHLKKIEEAGGKTVVQRRRSLVSSPSRCSRIPRATGSASSRTNRRANAGLRPYRSR